MSESFAQGRGESPRRRSGVGAWIGGTVAVLLACGGDAPAREPAGTIVLGESVAQGSASQVRIEMKAHGLFRPGLDPHNARDGAKMPKPLSVEIETRLVFYERVLALAEDETAIRTGPGGGGSANRRRGRPRKVVRHVMEGVAAINGEIRPRATRLRPEVALLVAERRADDGPVMIVSPAGPLTRTDLELVEVQGDPLILSDLLPTGPVAVGRPWRVGQAAAAGISGYDTITASSLEATLESVDEARARIRVRGLIEGSLQGAAGAMACDGVLTLDQRIGWIDRAEINRNESRRPGPIEAGLDVKSTLTMTRQAVERPPATLVDAALARYRLDVTPQAQGLIEYGPDGRSSFLLDRSWHVFWGDQKTMVLKKIDGGRVVAQCNLVVAAPAGRGRHQDPNGFGDEIRRVLGSRFVQFIGKGEIDGDPSGGYRYKVGVEGREGDVGVVWYYYLIAGPEGDQLVATYTLAAKDAAAFGDQDVEMIRTFRWLPARQASGRR